MKVGMLINSPNDASVFLREMTPRRGLGNALLISPGTSFLITAVLTAQPGIAEGDCMAVVPGKTTFYLIPKAEAESWAPAITVEFIAQGAMEAYSAVAQALGFSPDDEASPDDVVEAARWQAEQLRRLMGPAEAQESSQRELLVKAGADRPGSRPEGCDCANPPPYPGAPGAWGVSVACPVHGDGEEPEEEPVEIIHPADCQSCSEDAEPCSTHAQDWRYWQGRCLDAEEQGEANSADLDQIRALLDWSGGEVLDQPEATTPTARHLLRVIGERNEIRALRERLEPDYVLMMGLVHQLVEHLYFGRGLDSGTRGGAALDRRAKEPRVGDLVDIMGVLGVPVHLLVGFLEAIEPHPSGNPSFTTYQWRALDGQVFRYHNIQVNAVPAGNLYPSKGMLAEMEEYFQLSADQRPVGVNREPRESRVAFAEHARALALAVFDEVDADTERQAERHRARADQLAERTGQEDFLATFRERLGRWVPDRTE